MATNRYGYDDPYRQQAAPVRKKRKKKKKNNSLLFTMVILFLLGGAVGVYSFVFNKSQSTVSMTETPISTDSTYWNTGEGILYQTDGQIHFYHLSDQKKNYTYGTAASDIKMVGSADMTAVYNDLSIQVIGKKQPIQFAGRVMAVECGAGHVAVLQENEGGAQTLIVLTADGAEVDQLTFDPDQQVKDFGFYKASGEMLWIELLSVNSGTPTTTIRTYDVEKKAVSGVMQVQSQLLDGIYVTDQSIFAVGTNQIIRYTHDGNKEVYRNTVYGYQVIDYTLTSSPTFLMTPRGGDMHSVKMLTLAEAEEAAATETYLQLPTEGVAAYMMNGSLVVVSREKVYIYTLKGKLSREATFEFPVDDAKKLTERVLLLSSNGIYYLATI